MKYRSVGMYSGILCGTLLAVLSLASVRADDATQTKEKPANGSDQPKSHKMKPARLKIEVELTGTFEARKMSDVAIRPESWSTLIVKRAVDHGKVVKKGDPLVWLETDKLDDAIQTAEHGLKTSALALKQGEADLLVAEQILPIDLQSVQHAKLVADETLLDYMKLDRSRSITSAKRSLENSRFSLEYVQEELDQLKKMYEADDLTEETEEIILKRAERSVDSSKYSLESAEIRTARRLERDIPRTQQQLIDAAKRQEYELRRAKLTLPAGLETKRLALEKQRADLEKARENLAKLEKDRQSMIIKAPADGVVYYGRCVRGKWLDKTKADGMLVPGGTLSAKQTFITIVSRQPLDVRVELAEANLSKVQPGVKGNATPNGFEELHLPVKVDHVSYIPLSAGVFDCKLSVGNDAPIHKVMPGMTCKIKLVICDKPDALTVPPAALHDDDAQDGKQFVYLVSGDKTTRRDVKVGQRSSDAVEIVKGLKAGDEVLLGKPK